MTDASWLDTRQPAPPADLRARLAARTLRNDDLPSSLLDAASSALADALAQPGAREAAFDLLAADAWLTYACEAALEGEAPDESLNGLVSLGGAS